MVSDSGKPIVLCVDDDKDMLHLCEKFLTKDFSVLTASSATDALQMIKQVFPDLIVSDIMMPIMDGYQFFNEVKQRYPNRKVPFLFLTAKDRESDMIKGFGLGAEDYIIKPVSFRVLKYRLHTILNRATRPDSSIVQGRLEDNDLNSLLRQCSEKAFNGKIELQANGKTGLIYFAQGDIESVDFMGLDMDQAMNHLLDWKSGSFTIHQASLEIAPDSEKDSTELQESCSEKAPESVFIKYLPGLLHQFKVKKYDFQIQTEYLEGRITAILLKNGKCIKRSETVLEDCSDRKLAEETMKKLHHELIEEVQSKLEKITQSKPSKPSDDDRRDMSKSKTARQEEINLGETASGTAQDEIVRDEKQHEPRQLDQPQRAAVDTTERATTSLARKRQKGGSKSITTMPHRYQDLLDSFLGEHKQALCVSIFDQAGMLFSSRNKEVYSPQPLGSPLQNIGELTSQLAQTLTNGHVDEIMIGAPEGCLIFVPLSFPETFIMIAVKADTAPIVAEQWTQQLRQACESRKPTV